MSDSDQSFLVDSDEDLHDYVGSSSDDDWTPDEAFTPKKRYKTPPTFSQSSKRDSTLTSHKVTTQDEQIVDQSVALTTRSRKRTSNRSTANSASVKRRSEPDLRLRDGKSKGSEQSEETQSAEEGRSARKRLKKWRRFGNPKGDLEETRITEPRPGGKITKHKPYIQKMKGKDGTKREIAAELEDLFEYTASIQRREDTRIKDQRPQRARGESSQHKPNIQRKKGENGTKQEITAELEDLLEYTESIQRREGTKAPNKKSGDESDSGSENDDVLPPTYIVSCNKCGMDGDMVMRRTSADDRPFYTCKSCNRGFYWAEEAVKHLSSGPSCVCHRPSYPNYDEGHWYFVCANTSRKPCAFRVKVEQNVEDETEHLQATKKRAVETDQHYLVGEETRQKLQSLFHVPPQDSKELGHGRDSSKEMPLGYYDYLHVEKAWRVDSPDQHVRQFDAFRAAQRTVLKGRVRTKLRPEYARSVEELVETEMKYLAPLDIESNELLLIHGTKPTVVASILKNNLDPGLAHAGLFGRGTYFAEHAAKIDQYVAIDNEYCGGAREGKYGTLCELHNKLYPRPEMHPGCVYYALVCRVVFGDPQVTLSTVSRQASGRHSILAEVGGHLERFREFVVFEKYAVKIEYVVCFTRTKQYCYCEIPEPVRERTVQDEGRTRACVACPNSTNKGKQFVGGCGLFSVLPRCYCRRRDRCDFYGATMDSSQQYFACKGRNCTFKRLVEQGVDLRESDDDDDDDRFDYNDGWLVRG
jgi:Poly(ADP-ribose) polymerase catalytic domain